MLRLVEGKISGRDLHRALRRSIEYSHWISTQRGNGNVDPAALQAVRIPNPAAHGPTSVMDHLMTVSAAKKIVAGVTQRKNSSLTASELETVAELLDTLG